MFTSEREKCNKRGSPSGLSKEVCYQSFTYLKFEKDKQIFKWEKEKEWKKIENKKERGKKWKGKKENENEKNEENKKERQKREKQKKEKETKEEWRKN